MYRVQGRLADDDMEDLYWYRPGVDGLHPVHLHDRFSNQRYEVIAKLGHGSNSTVWCAIDHQDRPHQRKVALKISAIHSAHHDEVEFYGRAFCRDHPGRVHVARLLDSFWHRGPNGTHLCMVFPLMMADCRTLMWEGLIRQEGLLRSIARQGLMGLCHLHSVGIVHNDVHSQNIMATMPVIRHDELSFETPRFRRVRAYGEEKWDPSKPRYLLPAQKCRWDSGRLDWSAVSFKMVDLGNAMFYDDPEDMDLKVGAVTDRCAYAGLLIELVTMKFLYPRELLEIILGCTDKEWEAMQQQMRVVAPEMTRRLSNYLRWSSNTHFPSEQCVQDFTSFLFMLLQPYSLSRSEMEGVLRHPFLTRVPEQESSV